MYELAQQLAAVGRLLLMLAAAASAFATLQHMIRRAL